MSTEQTAPITLNGNEIDNACDVGIVGGGPVGTLLAILLGRQGRRVVLAERWPVAYDRPRAVTYDHEVARILADLGVDSDNDPSVDFHDELYYWKNAAGENLQVVDWQSTSASGWRVRYWFNQPDLEARLTELAAELPTVHLVRGVEAVGLDQDADGVDLSLRATDDRTATRTIRAKFVVGADGANSFVREAMGITSQDMGYFFDWLILDMIPHEPYAASPAQWQLCDPARPTTVVPGGPGRRRWEFMVLPGEDRDALAQPENAWNLLRPWGMTPDNSTLERNAVYRFQARWADTWNVGRVAIAGDAAHLMPPFAGEGMCAGLRDAVALGWRLNAILDGHLTPQALDSYTTERTAHVKHYIEFSQELGKIICICDPAEASARDAQMKADLAARGDVPVPTDLCSLGPGVWCPDTPHAGELSVQGVVQSAAGVRDRFDQVVGVGWTVLGLDHDPGDALTPQQRSVLERLGGRTVTVTSRGSSAGSADLVDVEGTYEGWMRDLGARFAIIRPDFYVAATATDEAHLQRAFAELTDLLGVPASALRQETV